MDSYDYRESPSPPTPAITADTPATRLAGELMVAARRHCGTQADAPLSPTAHIARREEEQP